MVVAADRESADMDFQGKHSGEKFQFYFYQHWVRLLWPACKLFIKDAILISVLIITLVVIGIEDDFSRRITLELFCVFFLLSHFEFLSRLYRFFLRVTVMTDRRVHRIKKSLLCMDDHQSVDLWMLQDVYRRQHSFIGNVLGYGTIILEAQETVLKIHYVPHIVWVAERVMYLREQSREHTTPYSVVRRLSKKAKPKIRRRRRETVRK